MEPGLASRAVALLAVAASVACSHAAPAPGSGGAGGGAACAGVACAVVTVRPDDAMVVLAHVDVQAPGFSAARVEYGDDTGYGRNTPAFPLAADGTASIPVLGLTPGATSHLRVCLDNSGCTADHAVVTGALPTGFPTFTVATSAAPPSGFLLLGAALGQEGPIWSTVLGPDARLWWYAASGTLAANAFEVNRTPLGAFLVYRSNQGFFDEVDLGGSSLHPWSVPGTDGANGHAIYPLDEDRMLMMSYGHDSNGSFDSFDTLTRDGQVQFHWQTPSYPANTDPYHPNSFTFDQSGALLASLRNVDTVLALDFSSAQTLWRLGGTMSDYTVVGDPLGGFSHQHSVTSLPNGHLLVFDNGNNHTPPASRVVEYTLDAGTKTATFAWQYQPNPPIFCFAGGSAERQPDGTTLIVWSFGDAIDSVAPDGTLLWELRANGTVYFYRGHWVTALYP